MNQSKPCSVERYIETKDLLGGIGKLSLNRPSSFGAKRIMKSKIPLAILIIMLISISLFASIQAQTVTQTKGGFDVKASELDKGKPSAKPTAGITTGIVSELADGGNKYAIIIGISDYDGTSNDLNYCDDDAQDFYNALTTVYSWEPANIIHLTTNAETKKSGILSAIDNLDEKEVAGDEVVFFYSGHGSISNYDIDSDGERKDECILPSDFSTNGAIWDGNLKLLFSSFESTRITFIFDSCYSGGMTDLSAPGRLVLMACGENQLSLESSAWQNGQFSEYFVDQGMLNSKADLNTDGKITFEEAFDYAKANCQRQTPTAKDNFTNDMLP
jgi:hypothetical protein